MVEILKRLGDYKRIHDEYEKIRASYKDQLHAYK